MDRGVVWSGGVASVSCQCLLPSMPWAYQSLSRITCQTIIHHLPSLFTTHTPPHHSQFFNQFHTQKHPQRPPFYILFDKLIHGVVFFTSINSCPFNKNFHYIPTQLNSLIFIQFLLGRLFWHHHLHNTEYPLKKNFKKKK